ncbi:MAG: HAD family hydrolase [Solirubrobacteraceae bacterium]
MSKLHIFDMDGTLLTGSACLDISRHMGRIEEVDAIEARWTLGKVGHVEFYDLCLPLWEGLSERDVDEVFARARWIEGIAEVFEDIAARGERSAVITLSPQFFVERLLAWGLHSAHGAGVWAGRAPDPAAVLTPVSKVKLARELMKRYEAEQDDCVAYGDSASDVPLFEMLSHTVAVNGSERLRELAAASYDGGDLREAYALGRELLEGSDETAGDRDSQTCRAR